MVLFDRPINPSQYQFSHFEALQNIFLGMWLSMLTSYFITTYLIFSEKTPQVSEPSIFLQSAANIQNMTKLFENNIYNAQ